MTKDTRIYPAFPIPAVGAIILNDGHVLLIQRGQAPAKGKWTLPGGVIEVGESPENALIREIQEECALDITIQGIVKVINKVFRDDQGKIMYHYVILDYLASCQSKNLCHELPIQARSDVINVRWVPVHDLSCYDTTEGLLDIIHAAIALQKQYV
jgi:mutator protein MutT